VGHYIRALGTVHLPVLRNRPVRSPGGFQRELSRVFSARQTINQKVSIRFAELGYR